MVLLITWQPNMVLLITWQPNMALLIIWVSNMAIRPHGNCLQRSCHPHDPHSCDFLFSTLLLLGHILVPWLPQALPHHQHNHWCEQQNTACVLSNQYADVGQLLNVSLCWRLPQGQIIHLMTSFTNGHLVKQSDFFSNSVIVEEFLESVVRRGGFTRYDRHLHVDCCEKGHLFSETDQHYNSKFQTISLQCVPWSYGFDTDSRSIFKFIPKCAQLRIELDISSFRQPSELPLHGSLVLEESPSWWNKSLTGPEVGHRQCIFSASQFMSWLDQLYCPYISHKFTGPEILYGFKTTQSASTGV